MSMLVAHVNQCWLAIFVKKGGLFGSQHMNSLSLHSHSCIFGYKLEEDGFI